MSYKPIHISNGQFGKCSHCNKEPTKEGYDGCIGELPVKEVMNACCGHGRDDMAYIQFWDKPRIAGLEAIEYIKLNNTH